MPGKTFVDDIDAPTKAICQLDMSWVYVSDGADFAWIEETLREIRFYFIIAACTGEDWVNAPAMWECYKKANAVYEAHGLSDHLVLHFHLLGHAVLQEDAELFLPYFDRMYYKMDVMQDLAPLKTTVFAGQEGLN